ncbi:MAG TPA: Ig-like domain-containing protein [Nitrolancea sp.]|nr:Ig-like domain-containing protein [Nitrolancea sp.]
MDTVRETGKHAGQFARNRGLRLFTILAFLATLLVPVGAQAIGPINQITISPDNLHALQGSTPTWTFTVLDSNGNPVSGQYLTYYVVGANAHSAIVLTTPTDANGQVTVSYTGTFSGTDVLTAFIDKNNNQVLDTGEVGSSTNVTWTHPVAVTLSPSAYTRTIYLTDVAGYGLETVHVTDASHTGLFGVTVAVSITGPNPLRVGGTVTETGTVTTDDNGNATFYDVGHIAGTDSITATVAGLTAATATLQWIHGPGVLLAGATGTNPMPLNSTATINITLRDTTMPIANVPIGINITGANFKQGTATTNANGDATFSYTSAVSGQDTLLIYADFDRSGTFSTGEPSNTVVIQWSGTATSNLSLSAASQSMTTGTQAALTATLTRSSGSVSGVNVRYSVTGENSGSGTAATNGSGIASITYTGTKNGTDTITAYADLNGNGTLDSGEPSASTTVTWSQSTPSNAAAIAAEAPATQQAGCTYFVETQHNLCGDFQSYWNKFGGLEIFGFPITEPFQENGVTVQYFERARFESHPGVDPSHFNVLLGLVGNEVTAGRESEAPFVATTANPASDCTYYAATGHNLCGGFQAYWNMYGGLSVYGYPISEEFQEKNPDTGQTYTVQYFQRGRFEWHPGENPSRFDVELGRLGSQVFSMKYGVAYH